MRTYVQDQWLRMGFVAGPDTVDYQTGDQLANNGQAPSSVNWRR